MNSLVTSVPQSCYSCKRFFCSSGLSTSTTSCDPVKLFCECFICWCEECAKSSIDVSETCNGQLFVKCPCCSNISLICFLPEFSSAPRLLSDIVVSSSIDKNSLVMVHNTLLNTILKNEKIEDKCVICNEPVAENLSSLLLCSCNIVVCQLCVRKSLWLVDSKNIQSFYYGIKCPSCKKDNLPLLNIRETAAFETQLIFDAMKRLSDNHSADHSFFYQAKSGLFKALVCILYKLRGIDCSDMSIIQEKCDLNIYQIRFQIAMLEYQHQFKSRKASDMQIESIQINEAIYDNCSDITHLVKLKIYRDIFFERRMKSALVSSTMCIQSNGSINDAQEEPLNHCHQKSIEPLNCHHRYILSPPSNFINENMNYEICSSDPSQVSDTEMTIDHIAVPGIGYLCPFCPNVSVALCTTKADFMSHLSSNHKVTNNIDNEQKECKLPLTLLRVLKKKQCPTCSKIQNMNNKRDESIPQSFYLELCSSCHMKSKQLVLSMHDNDIYNYSPDNIEFNDTGKEAMPSKIAKTITSPNDIDIFCQNSSLTQNNKINPIMNSSIPFSSPSSSSSSQSSLSDQMYYNIAYYLFTIFDTYALNPSRGYIGSDCWNVMKTKLGWQYAHQQHQSTMNNRNLLSPLTSGKINELYVHIPPWSVSLQDRWIKPNTFNTDGLVYNLDYFYDLQNALKYVYQELVIKAKHYVNSSWNRGKSVILGDIRRRSETMVDPLPGTDAHIMTNNHICNNTTNQLSRTTRKSSVAAVLKPTNTSLRTTRNSTPNISKSINTSSGLEESKSNHSQILKYLKEQHDELVKVQEYSKQQIGLKSNQRRKRTITETNRFDKMIDDYKNDDDIVTYPYWKRVDENGNEIDSQNIVANENNNNNNNNNTMKSGMLSSSSSPDVSQQHHSQPSLSDHSSSVVQQSELLQNLQLLLAKKKSQSPLSTLRSIHDILTADKNKPIRPVYNRQIVPISTQSSVSQKVSHANVTCKHQLLQHQTTQLQQFPPVSRSSSQQYSTTNQFSTKQKKILHKRKKRKLLTSKQSSSTLQSRPSNVSKQNKLHLLFTREQPQPPVSSQSSIEHQQLLNNTKSKQKYRLNRWFHSHKTKNKRPPYALFPHLSVTEYEQLFLITKSKKRGRKKKSLFPSSNSSYTTFNTSIPTSTHTNDTSNTNNFRGEHKLLRNLYQTSKCACCFLPLNKDSDSDSTFIQMSRNDEVVQNSSSENLLIDPNEFNLLLKSFETFSKDYDENESAVNEVINTANAIEKQKQIQIHKESLKRIEHGIQKQKKNEKEIQKHQLKLQSDSGPLDSNFDQKTSSSSSSLQLQFTSNLYDNKEFQKEIEYQNKYQQLQQKQLLPLPQQPQRLLQQQQQHQLPTSSSNLYDNKEFQKEIEYQKTYQLQQLSHLHPKLQLKLPMSSSYTHALNSSSLQSNQNSSSSNSNVNKYISLSYNMNYPVYATSESTGLVSHIKPFNQSPHIPTNFQNYHYSKQQQHLYSNQSYQPYIQYNATQQPMYGSESTAFTDSSNQRLFPPLDHKTALTYSSNSSSSLLLPSPLICPSLFHLATNNNDNSNNNSNVSLSNHSQTLSTTPCSSSNLQSYETIKIIENIDINNNEDVDDDDSDEYFKRKDEMNANHPSDNIMSTDCNELSKSKVDDEDDEISLESLNECISENIYYNDDDLDHDDTVKISASNDDCNNDSKIYDVMVSNENNHSILSSNSVIRDNSQQQSLTSSCINFSDTLTQVASVLDHIVEVIANRHCHNKCSARSDYFGIENASDNITATLPKETGKSEHATMMIATDINLPQLSYKELPNLVTCTRCYITVHMRCLFPTSESLQSEDARKLSISYKEYLYEIQLEKSSVSVQNTDIATVSSNIRSHDYIFASLFNDETLPMFPTTTTSTRAMSNKLEPVLKWLCSPCLQPEPKTDLCCIFCSQTDDGFYRQTGGGKWVHQYCALNSPGSSSLTADGIIEIKGIPNESKKNKCFVCMKTSGITYCCSHSGCNTKFHSICGVKRSKTYTVTRWGETKQFCLEHIPNCIVLNEKGCWVDLNELNQIKTVLSKTKVLVSTCHQRDTLKHEMSLELKESFSRRFQVNSKLPVTIS